MKAKGFIRQNPSWQKVILIAELDEEMKASPSLGILLASSELYLLIMIIWLISLIQFTMTTHFSHETEWAPLYNHNLEFYSTPGNGNQDLPRSRTLHEQLRHGSGWWNLEVSAFSKYWALFENPRADNDFLNIPMYLLYIIQHLWVVTNFVTFSISEPRKVLWMALRNPLSLVTILLIVRTLECE